MGGNTPDSRSGSAMVLPSAMEARVLRTAASTILLPAVRAPGGDLEAVQDGHAA